MNCYYCKQRTKKIDFKNTDELKMFISSLGKIRSKEKTGLCGFHQRKISKAIKSARHFGLLSPTKK